jgi:hypothetical protein
MTLFNLKLFVDRIIKLIVEHIKTKKKFPFAVLKNGTFWKRFPKGKEIHKFFHEMTQKQIIQFFGCFDIFVVRFNGINAVIEMTADPSSGNFETTLRVSISKGYKWFTERFSGRATPSIKGDLRNSICSTSPNSGFQGSRVENSFKQGLLTFVPFQGFGAGQATHPGFSFHTAFEKPTCGLSLLDVQPHSQVFSYDPFTSQKNFIPFQPSDEPLFREGQGRLKIVKGRVCRVEIPSGCSSGQSTSSTIRGIAKSPKEKTPISTTISILKNKIARLEKGSPMEGSLDHSDLLVAKAKLKKIQNSL